MNQITKQNKETTMEKVANTNVKSPLTPVSEAQKAQKNEHAANKDAEFKAKKAAAAKAFAERQKERKENLIKFAKEVVANKGFESLSADAKKFFNDCANPVVRTAGGSNQSFINKVFGDAPKVGDSITLLDYMKKKSGLKKVLWLNSKLQLTSLNLHTQSKFFLQKTNNI